jgi:cell division protein FtsB
VIDGVRYFNDSIAQVMKPLSRIVKLPSPEDGLRAMAVRAPLAEAMAASWIERLRPLATLIYGRRRRIATAGVLLLTGSLFVHVLFGANGMVVYKQKRAEYQSLHRQLDQVQQENERYLQQIQGLKSEEKAVEKEAREQLGYAKPGEYVYVAPPPLPAKAPANHTAKK